MTTDAIERTVELDAPPERVWRALTDPAELAAWFPDETVDLEVRLAPAADGGTRLSVRESGFRSEQHREQNRKGWKHELGELVEYVAGGS